MNFLKQTLTKIATGLNYIGFAISIVYAIYAYYTLDLAPSAMTTIIATAIILSLVFLVLGTTVFSIALDGENTYQTIRKFLMVNIFAYATIFVIATYFFGIVCELGFPLYAIAVILTEVFFLIKRK